MTYFYHYFCCISIKLMFYTKIFANDMVCCYSQGVIYLHDSDVVYHGDLRPTKCLVDSRWVLQLSGFRLHKFRRSESQSSVMDTEKESSNFNSSNDCNNLLPNRSEQVNNDEDDDSVNQLQIYCKFII